ncbi:MAG TPA: PQQ-binding-like beta-propeller repeat protein [Planctomycetaceae bacterium]|nr:PQQ-binding-like beta-propeller repeat protein [Planctomycetaceae bacterium]
MRSVAATGGCLFAVLTATTLPAGDWMQFRGPNGSARSSDAAPVHWSADENVQWKTPLPGPGSSSPIVVGERVFVTCYSGYGVDPRDAGQLEDLQRHLVCIDGNTGRILWDQTVAVEPPEDPYRGYINEHGYASSTPASDGERVYVFYGKSGVLAYDLDGQRLWKAGVGKESGRMRWGSAASPVVYKNLVVVNASDESQSVRGLDKLTGREVWKAEASTLEQVYGTPALVELPDGRAEFALAVPGELWGLDAATGKLNWYAEARFNSPVNPSAVVQGDVVYALGGRGAGMISVRAGGKGDVTDSNVLWTSQATSYVPSPVLHEGRLYLVDDNGVAVCVDAKSGDVENRRRLGSAPAGPGGPGGGGRGGGRGYYSSVVVAGDKLYAVSRKNGTFVLTATPELEQLAQNPLDDDSDFNASPAVDDGRLLLRSNQFLYCIAENSATK